jgi:hypothetical protein
VISFMGIGLVDPILPSLATKLQASRSQVELLFTSYLPFVLGAVTVAASALVLSTVHRALTAADAEEAQPGPSHERIDVEDVVFEVPGSPEEAVIANEALREDGRTASENATRVQSPC